MITIGGSSINRSNGTINAVTFTNFFSILGEVFLTPSQFLKMHYNTKYQGLNIYVVLLKFLFLDKHLPVAFSNKKEHIRRDVKDVSSK